MCGCVEIRVLDFIGREAGQKRIRKRGRRGIEVSLLKILMEMKGGSIFLILIGLNLCGGGRDASK